MISDHSTSVCYVELKIDQNAQEQFEGDLELIRHVHYSVYRRVRENCAYILSRSTVLQLRSFRIAFSLRNTSRIHRLLMSRSSDLRYTPFNCSTY